MSNENTTPAPQRVGACGIDAHRAMGDAVAPECLPPDQILRQGAQDAGFQSFVYTTTSTRRPATYYGTIEAVFRHIGATCWADLQKPEQLRVFHNMLRAYAETVAS